MYQLDLKGKTIMIATTHDVTAELDIGALLEQLGAKVVYESLPVHPDSLHVTNIERSLNISLIEDPKIPTFMPIDPDWKQKSEAERIVRYKSAIQQKCVRLCEKIEKHKPKIDAIILHNMDIKQESTRISAVNLTKGIKERCPVVVCDYCDSQVAIQPLRDAGALLFNLDTLCFEPLAGAIAGIVAQHGKPERKIGG